MESADIKLTSSASQISIVTSRGVAINASSPKMGSRRIFTPQFKLQVLESYRNDSDCKGNQRATARKYNIHRRQIQKWLQCESSLRSSVANINHSSVKHQFHNVSLQHQQQPQSQTQRNTDVTNNSTGNALPSSQRHPRHFCADVTRPEMPLSCVKVPTITTENNTASISEDVFKASNLVSVAAAAAINSTNSTCSSSSAAAVAPLRPSPIISSGSDTISPVSSVYHSHHYGVPTFNLSHNQHHIISQTHQPHDLPSYQYHKLVYPLTLSHHHTDKQQPTYFTPTNLPTAINIISSTTSTTNSYTTANVEYIDNANTADLQSKNYPLLLSDKNINLTDISGGIFNSSSVHQSYIKNDVQYSPVFPFGPMDLSIHHRREVKSQPISNIHNQHYAKTEQSSTSREKVCNNKEDVVDLTYRKRKMCINTVNSSDEYNISFAEKLQKLSNVMPNNNEDEDIEIEVGVEEKFPPSKPVKLFKPYLLDNCENDNNSTASSSNKYLKHKHNELTEKNLTRTSNSNFILSSESTHPVALRESKISCTENYNFLVDSRSLSPRSAFSPAITVTTLSSKGFQCPKGSPASSGYESSTSSYSDSSLSSRCETYGYEQTCSINLRMQSIYSENPYQSKHVQTWLDKDDSELLTTNSSIALLA